MAVKSIRLCEGHKGGFTLVRIMSPRAVYRGTLINKLAVVVCGKESCVQCKANRAKAARLRK